MSTPDAAVPRIAAAIGEPARARMLYCLMDGRARTSTELAVVGDVSPSTASVHLGRLEDRAAGQRPRPGQASLLQPERRECRPRAGGVERPGRPAAADVCAEHPSRLRAARTCYDHMAGTVAVALHDRLVALKWLTPRSPAADYALDRRRCGGTGRARDRPRDDASRCGAGSRSPAWTGASGALTSAARWARRCWSSRCAGNGSRAISTAAS